MTVQFTPEERDSLAGEYALGVLEGEELRQARLLERSDPQFSDSVTLWSERLAPMLDEIAPVEPPSALWSSIERVLPSGDEPSNVVVLRRRASLWRGATAAVSAIAASLALILVTRPPARPVEQPRPAAPMVATLGDSAGVKLLASWSPSDRMLVVATAADMPVDRSHAHELWVIPTGGKPQSLGTMPNTRHMVMHVPQPLSSQLRSGAVLAVSLEPAGGSTTGAPTGPVLVSGQLENA